LGGPQNYVVQAIAQVINSPTDGTLSSIADGFELPAVPAGEFLGCPGAGSSAGNPLTVSRDYSSAVTASGPLGPGWTRSIGTCGAGGDPGQVHAAGAVR
jgi:hypothetical protein